MATVLFELSTTEWTKVSDAGETGACWKKTGGQVCIDHTDAETAATLPLSNTNVTVGKSKRVPLDTDEGNSLLSITPSSVTDIYYALSLGGDDEKIVTDMET